MKHFVLFVSLLWALSAQAQVSTYYNESNNGFFTVTLENQFDLPLGLEGKGFLDIDTYDSASFYLSFFRYHVGRQVYNNFGAEIEFDEVPIYNGFVLRVLPTYKLDLPKLEGSYLVLKIAPWSPNENSGQRYSIIPHIEILDNLIVTGYINYHVGNTRQAIYTSNHERGVVAEIQGSLGSGTISRQSQNTEKTDFTVTQTRIASLSA